MSEPLDLRAFEKELLQEVRSTLTDTIRTEVKPLRDTLSAVNETLDAHREEIKHLTANHAAMSTQQAILETKFSTVSFLAKAAATGVAGLVIKIVYKAISVVGI